MKKTKEDESMFSESSEEELLADSPKLQRANAKRFGKVSYEMTCPEELSLCFFCLWYSFSVVSYFFELFLDTQGIFLHICSSGDTFYYYREDEIPRRQTTNRNDASKSRSVTP